jgi:hypothetical protein
MQYVQPKVVLVWVDCFVYGALNVWQLMLLPLFVCSSRHPVITSCLISLSNSYLLMCVCV